MEAIAILEHLEKIGVQVNIANDKLQFRPGQAVPSELIPEIKAHKQELIVRLRDRDKPKLADASHQWHAETIAAAVQKEGVSIFWSEMFSEMIAFIHNDTFKSHVPCSIVAYTDKELKELFGEGKSSLSAESLRLIHEAKKAGGGHIICHKLKGEQSE